MLHECKLCWIEKGKGRPSMKVAIAKPCIFSKSSGWTERSVETASTVHVLSVLRLLLLAHAVDIVAGNLGILRSPESRETHTFSHHCFHLVFVSIFFKVHIHFFLMIGPWRAIRLSPIISGPRILAIWSAIASVSSRRRRPRPLPGAIPRR